MKYLSFPSLAIICLLVLVGCSNDLNELDIQANNASSTEISDKRFSQSDPYFEKYTVRSEKVDLITDVVQLLKASDATDLLRPKEYLLASASRYVIIDTERYSFVPIMSNESLMPEDFLVLPIDGSNNQSPYRFVDQFGVHLGVNSFFSHEILSGLEDDAYTIIPTELEVRTSPADDNKGCRVITVYVYTNYYVASPDRRYNFLDYVGVNEYQTLECTGVIPGGVSYANFPGGSGSPGPTRTQQQSGNVGVIADHLCIDPIDDLSYSGTSITNDFTVRLNDFAFEFRVTLPNGTFLYPVIRFNNLQLSATGVYVNQGPAFNSPYGTTIAIEFEAVIENAIKGAEGWVQGRVGTDATTYSLQTDLAARFIHELNSNMQRSPGLRGASSRNVVADNDYSSSSTKTNWDPGCTK